MIKNTRMKMHYLCVRKKEIAGVGETLGSPVFFSICHYCFLTRLSSGNSEISMCKQFLPPSVNKIYCH